MKEYMGDSVYVERDGYDITLTTENGYGSSGAAPAPFSVRRNRR